MQDGGPPGARLGPLICILFKIIYLVTSIKCEIYI